MGEILLARSAATDFDDEERIMGKLSIPISVKGQAQIAQIAKEINGRSISRIFSTSDLSARETAAALGEQLGVPVKVIEELSNLDYGLWQGLPVAEIRRKHPTAYRQWEESPVGICPPAGETIEQLHERVQKPLKRMLRKSQNETVVVIAPDPLRKVLRCCLNQTSLEKVWQNGQTKLIESFVV